ncbi:PRTase-like protein [Daldinia bambusicola]|nr:PRTase-like protein [Daldinia bambusicola]
MVEKIYVTYNDVHKLCQEAAPKILSSFKPQLIIAIGGGGYVPARILRSFLKQPGSPNIPIQAIGLSLYEQLPVTDSSNPTEGVVDQIGTKVTRTQWLDLSSLGEIQNLVGKRILIVDEVDDTRTTLEYAVKELEKDVEEARKKLGNNEKTEFSIFVLHNKDKQKKGTLPAEMMEQSRYLAARTIGDEWICYPWEATDIDLHDELAKKQMNGNGAA